jgi:hypothetical protein
MDPILEEMKRSREMRPDRFRTCVDYLCALVAAKDDQIAALTHRLDELTSPEALSARLDEIDARAAKRGPGRPRKEAAHV